MKEMWKVQENMFARKSEGEQTVDKKADHSSPAEGRDIVARPSFAVRGQLREAGSTFVQLLA